MRSFCEQKKLELVNPQTLAMRITTTLICCEKGVTITNTLIRTLYSTAIVYQSLIELKK